MNVIKVNVNFKNKKIYMQDVTLTSGDYNSTKLVFEFDRQDGKKVFEMKNPDGELVLLTDIENNEVDLVGKDENGNNASLFNQKGDYIFEISLYDGDSKLTSAFKHIPVELEQVIVDGKPVTAYLPTLDRMIREVENLNIEVDGNILTITKKDGSKESTNVQGPKGDPGVIKMMFFATKEDLPETGSGDTLYFVKVDNPTETNYYQEYAWVNKGTEELPNWDWEDLGGAVLNVDLTDYVKKTDYALYYVGNYGVVKVNQEFGITTDTIGQLILRQPSEKEIDNRHQNPRAITTKTLDYAVGTTYLKGTEAPTTETVAKFLGQLYVDTTNNATYQCSAIDTETPSYTWVKLIRETDTIGKTYDGSPGLVVIDMNSALSIYATKTGGLTLGNANARILNKNSDNAIRNKDLDYAIKVGMTTNTQTWTEEEKASARDLIGAVDNTAITGLDNVLRDILTAIQDGGTTSNTISEIENIIVSYLETKTVEEVEA